MKRLAIIGSGDLGQLIAYHAVTDKQFDVVGYFDDYREKGTYVGSTVVLGKIENVAEIFDQDGFDCLVMGIGYKHFEHRKKIFNDFWGTIPFATFVHSSCFVDPSCRIGDGTVLLPGGVFDRNVVIGNNVLVNTGACIAHDSVVNAHSFLSPRVAIAGFSTIGECCNIGINSTIIDNIVISDYVQTGGGTVVIKNMNERGVYVGNPAKFIR